MITRIEVDGFKTFNHFILDLHPFLAILGPNAAGKSNFFDAIQFLRRVTDSGLSKAVEDARGGVDDLFRRLGDGSSVNQMSFAVEVLLEPRVKDSWGTEVDLTQTRVRYELEIVRRTDEQGNTRLIVERESAVPLRRGYRDLARMWAASRTFIDSYLVDGKRQSAFLETGRDDSRGKFFQIRQDGVQGRARPAEAAEATVLSSISSAEFKHLYALREEISSWRFLQLEPNSLRRVGERFGEDRLMPDGGNLPRVLSRMRSETATSERPDGVLAAISADLSSLIPSVRRIDVRENKQTRKWEVHVTAADGETYRADVASDGTLRVLALLAALYDPRYRGVICFEEPENGVHPFRLRRLIQYLESLVTNPSGDVDADSPPLAQVIVNSHSPVVLAALRPQNCVFIESANLVEAIAVGESTRRVRSRVSHYRRLSSGDQVPLSLPDDDAAAGDGAAGMVAESEIWRYKAIATLEDSE